MLLNGKSFCSAHMDKSFPRLSSNEFITQIINYAFATGLVLICLNQIGIPTNILIAAFEAFGLGIVSPTELPF